MKINPVDLDALVGKRVRLDIYHPSVKHLRYRRYLGQYSSTAVWVTQVLRPSYAKIVWKVHLQGSPQTATKVEQAAWISTEAITQILD